MCRISSSLLSKPKFHLDILESVSYLSEATSANDAVEFEMTLVDSYNCKLVDYCVTRLVVKVFIRLEITVSHKSQQYII